MSELSDATAALTQAAASHGAAKASFDAYLAALSNPSGLETLGFKRLNIARLFDDANPTIPYPGGTSIADATVSHSLTYQSIFEDEETEIYFQYSTNIGLYDGNTVDNQPRAQMAVTDGAGVVLSNVVVLTAEIAGDGQIDLDTVAASGGKVTKPSGQSTVEFQHRLFMDLGDPNAGQSARVDVFDITIWEVVR